MSQPGVASSRPLGRLRRLRRHRSALVGAGIVAILVLMAVAGPALAPFSPLQMQLANRLAPPAPPYLLGTDEFGRDILSRLIHGARVSLTAGCLIVLLAATAGSLLGAWAAVAGSWVDRVLMRLADIFLAFPALVLAMALVAALGPGLLNAMLAVAIIAWPGYARLVRAQILTAIGQPYVEAAVSLGAPRRRLLVRHILPNCLAPLTIKMTMDAGYAILLTASLSFVGLGAQPPTPEWGAMITTGRRYLLDHWWYPTVPGAAIFLAVLGFSLLGDGLRDALDPRLRER